MQSFTRCRPFYIEFNRRVWCLFNLMPVCIPLIWCDTIPGNTHRAGVFLQRLVYSIWRSIVNVWFNHHCVIRTIWENPQIKSQFVADTQFRYASQNDEGLLMLHIDRFETHASPMVNIFKHYSTLFRIFPSIFLDFFAPFVNTFYD